MMMCRGSAGGPELFPLSLSRNTFGVAIAASSRRGCLYPLSLFIVSTFQARARTSAGVVLPSA